MVYIICTKNQGTSFKGVLIIWLWNFGKKTKTNSFIARYGWTFVWHSSKNNKALHTIY